MWVFGDQNVLFLLFLSDYSLLFFKLIAVGSFLLFWMCSFPSWGDRALGLDRNVKSYFDLIEENVKSTSYFVVFLNF